MKKKKKKKSPKPGSIIYSSLWWLTIAVFHISKGNPFLPYITKYWDVNKKTAHDNSIFKYTNLKNE